MAQVKKVFLVDREDVRTDSKDVTLVFGNFEHSKAVRNNSTGIFQGRCSLSQSSI